MPRLAWLTDLHLNFVAPARFDQLLGEIAAERPDGLLIGGDTGEGHSFVRYLERIAKAVGVPVWFVLGNHDFYRSSIVSTRLSARLASRREPNLHWLCDAGVVRVGEDTALVGHDGWADARTPNFDTSDVLLNDYLLIEELRATTGVEQFSPEAIASAGVSLLTPGLKMALHELGDESAAHFRRVVPEACEAAAHIVVLTHVPPFREACWHERRISDNNWAPHFCNVAAGRALAECMEARPDRRMTVLCGHTHGAGTATILPNLTVITGGARYGEPRLQRMIDVG